MDIINGRWKQPKHGEMSQEGQAWGVPGGGIKVSCLMMDVWARPHPCARVPGGARVTCLQAWGLVEGCVAKEG